MLAKKKPVGAPLKEGRPDTEKPQATPAPTGKELYVKKNAQLKKVLKINMWKGLQNMKNTVKN